MDYSTVKGTHDVYGKEAAGITYISNVLKAVAELYAYSEIIPPVLEYTEVFSRGTGESSDIVRKEMYTFLDKGDRSVTMRPEFTAGVVRAVVSNKLYATEDLPLKLYYCGPAFRYERPQLGRYRQFNQFGVEEIGLDSARADAECVIMAIQGLSMLGFEKLSLKINTIGDEESRGKYREALKTYFAGHIDQMCDDCHERLKLNPMRILDCKVEADQEIAKGAPKIKDYLSAASEKRFYETLSILNDLGIDYEIDDSLVRGLDYYSEMVFEIHAISKEGNDFGALCGGGHYGGLVKELGGPDLPGVGFAMGIERIYSLMEDNRMLNALESGIDLYVMPVGEAVLDDVFQLTEQVRTLGYSAETPLQALKMGAMFKKAEKRGAKFALILGEDELKKGIAQLKNLASKEQKEIKLDHLEEELDSAFAAIQPKDECDDPNCSCHEHEDHDEEGCGCGCGGKGECHCHDQPADPEDPDKDLVAEGCACSDADYHGDDEDPVKKPCACKNKK
jgi:histidyl-tRNA synthetase